MSLGGRKGTTDRRVGTDLRSDDPRLRGRTYAIPFDRVWNSILALAGEEVGRWRVLRVDDEKGIIEAEAVLPILGVVGAIRFDVRLDPEGQTRVDMSCTPPGRRGSVRGAAGRIGRFFNALDRRLEVSRDQILHSVPNREPEY